MSESRPFEEIVRDRNPDFRTYPPIDDMLLVLWLLQREWNDRTMRRLIAGPVPVPYIEVMICNGGYTRDLHDSSEYYPVSGELVQELRRGYLVQGTPHWGYTDQNEMTIAERGHDVCSTLTDSFVEDVKAYLKKEHPDVEFVQTTVRPRLHDLSYRKGYSDFFIGVTINEKGDEVRRTRGVLSLVRKENAV